MAVRAVDIELPSVAVGPGLVSPTLTTPIMTSPISTSPIPTTPIMTSPVSTYPIMTSPTLTTPIMTSPVSTYPIMTTSVSTTSNLTNNVLQQSLLSTERSHQYDDVLLLMGEVEIGKQGDPSSDILVPDPNFDFLRNVIGESEDGIRQEVGNAIKYFESQFGLDLTSYRRQDGMWIQNGNQFSSNYISSMVGYLPYSSNGNLVSGKVYSGGFSVVIGSSMVATGNYGGTTGKIIPAGSVLSFGYYKIEFDDGTKRIIHYRSTNPSIPTPFAILPIDYEVYDFELKRWGHAIGTSSTRETQTTRHISIRNTITIPRKY
jgi:hypothetical protein